MPARASVATSRALGISSRGRTSNRLRGRRAARLLPTAEISDSSCPAHAGHPVIASVRASDPTPVVTGSSAFADDDARGALVNDARGSLADDARESLVDAVG